VEWEPLDEPMIKPKGKGVEMSIYRYLYRQMNVPLFCGQLSSVSDLGVAALLRSKPAAELQVGSLEQLLLITVRSDR
jgi:hypothetical protein